MSSQPVSGVLFNAYEQKVQWDLGVVHRTVSNGWTALARPWSSPGELEANGSSFSSQRCLHPPKTVQAEMISSKQQGYREVGQESAEASLLVGSPGSAQFLTSDYSFQQ